MAQMKKSGRGLPHSIGAVFPMPSKPRLVLAWCIYFVTGIAAFAWKIKRQDPDIGSEGLFPTFLAVAPNILPAVALPFLVFIRPKTVTFHEFMQTAALMAAMLMAYEVAQIMMPSRTFDWRDLLATAIGSLMAILLGWLVFFRCLGQAGNGAQSLGANQDKA